MPECVYCGADAPYSCDAPGEEPGALCGKTVCAEHAHPRVEGTKDIGRNTLCEDHLNLQKPRPGARKQPQKRSADWWENPQLDPTVEYAPLVIDEAEYALAWSFGAIAKAEALCRRSLTQDMNLMQGIASFILDLANAQQYLGLLHAALTLAYPEVTLDQAAALIRIDTLPDIRLALITAYNLSMPEKKRLQVVVTEAPN